MNHIIPKILLSVFVFLLLIESFISWQIQLPAFAFIAADKIKHIASGFILILLFKRAFPKLNIMWAGAILFIGGIGVEVLQHLLTNGARSADIYDVLANGIGFLGGIIVWIINNRYQDKKMFI